MLGFYLITNQEMNGLSKSEGKIGNHPNIDITNCVQNILQKTVFTECLICRVYLRDGAVPTIFKSLPFISTVCKKFS